MMEPPSPEITTEIYLVRHGEMIAQVVKTLRDERVRFVDTTGWIEPGKDTTDKVHLNLNGNKIAAEKLAPILRSVL